MAAITIKNMDVTYNKGKSYVIKDMNLEIKDGEFCVFLGPSGCGKSTAMYCIAGLGFANPFLSSFKGVPEYADTFGVNHANALISLSQVSETLCILLIPFVLKHFGIKRVMLIAMLAWVLRFGLFGLGNPGPGVWMFVLSMIVYGVAFDFFNISGSLFVNNETDLSIRSSAQGLFVIMTNGIGATVGTLGAQAVVNRFVDMNSSAPQMEGWSMTWFVFAGYALAVAVLFAVIFKYKHRPGQV